jgi:hypothetical protein
MEAVDIFTHAEPEQTRENEGEVKIQTRITYVSKQCILFPITTIKS